MIRGVSFVPWLMAIARKKWSIGRASSLNRAAGLEIKAHPHMLRHATGYALANQGTDTRTLQVFLGHRNISNTAQYTELAAGRFKNLWKD